MSLHRQIRKKVTLFIKKMNKKELKQIIFAKHAMSVFVY